MFDHSVVILREAEFGKRIVERPPRGNQQRCDMQPTSALCRVLLRHHLPPKRRIEPVAFPAGAAMGRDENFEPGTLLRLSLPGTVQAHIPVEIYAHDQSDAEHHRQHRRSTIGDKRQGDADNRNKTRYHRDIDKHI